LKAIIFSYSRFGNGTLVAEALARELKAELRHVLARPRGYPAMGLEALLKSTPKIEPIDTRIDGADVVILGFPLRMGQPGAPMRTLLRELDLKDRRIAYWVMNNGNHGELGNLTPDFDRDLKAKGARVIYRSGLGSAHTTETDKAAFAEKFARRLTRALASDTGPGTHLAAGGRV
jgi:hypothetical protein